MPIGGGEPRSLLKKKQARTLETDLEKKRSKRRAWIKFLETKNSQGRTWKNRPPREWGDGLSEMEMEDKQGRREDKGKGKPTKARSWGISANLRRQERPGRGKGVRSGRKNRTDKRAEAGVRVTGHTGKKQTEGEPEATENPQHLCISQKSEKTTLDKRRRI